MAVSHVPVCLATRCTRALGISRLRCIAGGRSAAVHAGQEETLSRLPVLHTGMAHGYGSQVFDDLLCDLALVSVTSGRTPEFVWHGLHSAWSAEVHRTPHTGSLGDAAARLRSSKQHGPRLGEAIDCFSRMAQRLFNFDAPQSKQQLLCDQLGYTAGTQSIFNVNTK